jgi:hypothetical protein
MSMSILIFMLMVMLMLIDRRSIRRGSVSRKERLSSCKTTIVKIGQILANPHMLSSALVSAV